MYSSKEIKFPTLRLLNFALLYLSFACVSIDFPSALPSPFALRPFRSFGYCELTMLIFLSSVTALQVQRPIINESEDLAVTLGTSRFPRSKGRCCVTQL